INSLWGEGATHYIATPLSMTGKRHHAATAATDAPGGFTEAHMAIFEELVPALATIMETRAVRKIGANLLQTYLGRHAGPRILDGQDRAARWPDLQHRWRRDVGRVSDCDRCRALRRRDTQRSCRRAGPGQPAAADALWHSSCRRRRPR